MKFRKMTPVLSVENITKTVNFYQQILGFQLHMLVTADTHTMEDTLLDTEEYVYAMLSRDELYIMFLKESEFKENIPVLEKNRIGASVLFYIEVEKIDELYNSLQESPIKIVKELTTTWYGMREFYIKDCNGYVLAFAEQV
ncbi:VOC family protein [bacterium]|nr:VOC family protein [bacterium]MBU1958228.1 VOC family protein [bacterium]